MLCVMCHQVLGVLCYVLRVICNLPGVRYYVFGD